MKKLFAYHTVAGTFFICRKDRIYFSLLEREIVDSDSTPETLARRLHIGEHVALMSGIEINTLDIPADLKQWKKVD